MPKEDISPSTDMRPNTVIISMRISLTHKAKLNCSTEETPKQNKSERANKEMEKSL